MNSDTFVEVAEDCPAVHAEVPPARGDRPTKAAIEYELKGANIGVALQAAGR